MEVKKDRVAYKVVNTGDYGLVDVVVKTMEPTRWHLQCIIITWQGMGNQFITWHKEKLIA